MSWEIIWYLFLVQCDPLLFLDHRLFCIYLFRKSNKIRWFLAKELNIDFSSVVSLCCAQLATWILCFAFFPEGCKLGPHWQKCEGWLCLDFFSRIKPRPLLAKHSSLLHLQHCIYCHLFLDDENTLDFAKRFIQFGCVSVSFLRMKICLLLVKRDFQLYLQYSVFWYCYCCSFLYR